jgi:nucleoside 2-deoxyribosyltransferase
MCCDFTNGVCGHMKDKGSKTMRIYLAGPWVDRDKMPAIAKQIEAMGHTITHPWWQYEGESQENESLEFLENCARQDVRAVRTADMIVVYNSAKSEGKAVEQGLAIAYGIPIICITQGVKPSSNIFHYLTKLYIHVTTVDQALALLR